MEEDSRSQQIRYKTREEETNVSRRLELERAEQENQEDLQFQKEILKKLKLKDKNARRSEDRTEVGRFESSSACCRETEESRRRKGK